MFSWDGEQGIASAENNLAQAVRQQRTRCNSEARCNNRRRKPASHSAGLCLAGRIQQTASDLTCPTVLPFVYRSGWCCQETRPGSSWLSGLRSCLGSCTLQGLRAPNVRQLKVRESLARLQQPLFGMLIMLLIIGVFLAFVHRKNNEDTGGCVNGGRAFHGHLQEFGTPDKNETGYGLASFRPVFTGVPGRNTGGLAVKSYAFASLRVARSAGVPVFRPGVVDTPMVTGTIIYPVAAQLVDGIP
jgi:hypothetical protein